MGFAKQLKAGLRFRAGRSYFTRDTFLIGPKLCWMRRLWVDKLFPQWPTLLAYAALVLLAYGLRSLVFYNLRIQPSLYEGPLIFSQWLLHGSLVARVLLALVTLFLAVRVSWRTLVDSSWLRPLVLAMVGLLLLFALLIPPNPYFGQFYTVDRLLLLALALLVVRYPAATAPFLVGVLLFVQQTAHPILSYHSFFSSPVVDLLVAFVAMALLHGLGWATGSHILIMVIASNMAGSYVNSGLAKMALGPAPWSWVQHNELGNFLISAWQYGWWPWASEEFVLGVGQIVNDLSPALLAISVLLELAAGFVLFNRRFGMAVLLALGGVHLSVLGLSGACFWGFLTVDMVLVWLLVGRSTPGRVCGVSPGLMLLLLTTLCPWLFNPIEVAWWDTRFNNLLKLEVIDEFGNTHPAPYQWFAPYQYAFIVQTYQPLLDLPMLVESHGITKDFELMMALREASTDPEKMEGLLRDAGDGASRELDLARLQPFADVVKRTHTTPDQGFIGLWRRLPLRTLHPFKPTPPRPETRLRSVQVRLVMTVMNGNGIQVVKDEVILKISLR